MYRVRRFAFEHLPDGFTGDMTSAGMGGEEVGFRCFVLDTDVAVR